MNWEKALQCKAEQINAALDLLLPSVSTYPIRVHEAMRYSVFAGGKRLRGALTMAVAEVLGTDEQKVLPAAAAVEMIHTYSLIHDDLPAMDDDDYRRGKPSCHKAYGEAVAILAGDALLTLAFETLAHLQEKGFEPQIILQVIQEVGSAAGSQGLIGGQVVDLESEGIRVSEKTLEYIHNHKTAALFLAAVRTGGLLAAASDKELRLLGDYASAFGLAFQITDDLLDLTGDEQLMGKKTGCDLAKDKATYPALLGVEQAKRLAEEQVKGYQSGLTKGNQPHVRRCYTLYIFFISDTPLALSSINMLRHRHLQDYPSDIGVCIQPSDMFEQLLLGHICRQFLEIIFDATKFSVFLLSVGINPGCLILSYLNRHQTRRDTLCL